MANDDDKLAPGEVRSDGDAIANAADDLSWIGAIREERDKRVETEALKLGMPTWGPADEPDLVVEYHVLPRKRLEKFQKEQERQRRKRKDDPNDTSASDSDIAFLAESAKAVYMRRPDTGQLIKVTREGEPVRLNRALGEVLKVADDVKANSRALLLYLVKDNGIALGNLAWKVSVWMTNTSAEVEGEILGE